MPFGNNVLTARTEVFRADTSEMVIKGRQLRCTLGVGLPHRTTACIARPSDASEESGGSWGLGPEVQLV
jgi:hypothetical protein